MADAKITKAPTARPAYMTTPKRQSGGSREMKVTWKNPSSATDRNNSARATGIKIVWDLVLVAINDPKKTLVRHFDEAVGDNTLTTATLNLNAFRPREFPKEIWTRDTFYPGTTDNTHEWTKMWCLRTIRCGVYYTNAKGTGPGTVTAMNWQRPFATSVAKPVQNESTGHVDCKVATPKGDDHLEIHSGWWTRTVYDSRTKKTDVGHGKITRGASVNVAYDVADREQLTYSQYVRFTVSAFTRGYWGDSEVRTQTLYVSYPNEPIISSVSIPSKNGSDKVTVLINTQQATSAHPEHPVTGVRLQVLRSTTYSTAAQVATVADDEWTDIGVQDDGECTALACTVGEVKPTADTYSWIRLKSWNQYENLHYRYSKPYRLKTLETKSPTAAGDGCTITKAEAGKDGTSIVVTTTYDEDNKNTGTEITWSQYKDAWTSTDQPESFEATWKSDTSTYTKNNKTYYRGTVEITVRGLDPNTKYYFKARRYLDIEDKERTYSSWSNTKECTTLADPDAASSSNTKAKPRPDSVTLIVPNFTPRGDDIPATWTFQPDSSDNIDEKLADKQTGWELFVPKNTYTVKRATGSAAAQMNPEWSIASGEDAKGAYTIPYSVVLSTMTKILGTLDGVRDEMKLRVRVRTSGNWRESSTVTAHIADVPELMAYAQTVTKQPAWLEFYCNQKARLNVVVRAAGASGEMPWGVGFQANGDTIWSGVVNPRWEDYDPTKTAQYAELLQDLADAQQAASVTALWCANMYNGYEAQRAFQQQYGDPWWFSKQTYRSGNRVGLLVDKSSAMQSYGTLSASTYDGTEWSAWAAADVTTELVTTDATCDEILVTFANAADYAAWQAGTLTLASEVVTLDKDVSASVETAQEAIDAYLDTAYAYAATVTLPDGLDLWDGCSYEVSATATNTTTRLTSDVATDEFEVEWARQAPVLGEDDVTVVPHDEWDEDGNHTLSATITLPSDSRFLDTDRFDVYRVTADGPRLMYSDASAGQVIVDPYAPYSKRADLAYRVAVHTDDGDMAWYDYAYDLRWHGMRIEFGSSSVELPYNVVPNDAYAKDFESRRYMDGSIDGFWNAGVMHTGGFSTDLMKIKEPERLRLVRELAMYAGECFVRTEDGHAYAANVTVNSIGTDYKALAYNVSIDVNEVEDAGMYLGTGGE